MGDGSSTRDRTGTTRRRVLASLSVGMSNTVLPTVSRGEADGRRVAGLTRPTVDQGDVVREDVWVETGTDTDDAGTMDRVHVEVARPASTGDGTTVPVILRPDPYRMPHPDRIDGPRGLPEELPEDVRAFHEAMRDMEVELYRPTDDTEGPSSVEEGALDAPVRQAPDAQEDDRFFYEQYFLANGYAFAYVSPIGSSLSTGCNQLGGPAEVASVRSVVDWLNDRTTGYDARRGGETVTAAWTTGTTGMLGGSYRGALAIGVATTGVDGLETVVPIRAMASWYTYLRSMGAVITPGNEGPSRGTNLAVLSALLTSRRNNQRCDDTIVEIASSTDPDSGNYNDFWAARDYLRDAASVRASVLVVHGLHDEEVRPINAARWIAALDDNDVPYKVWLHRGGHGDPRERHETPWLSLLERWFDHWLKGETNGVMDEPTAVVEQQGGGLVAEADWPHPEARATSLGVVPNSGPTETGSSASSTGPVTESLVDDSDVPPTALLGPDHTAHRLVYWTPPLDDSVRISGIIRPRLKLSFDSPAALVSGALVDNGPDGPAIVNRGWMNPQNRASLRESRPMTPGEPYRISFPLQPVDHVVRPGHRFGVMLYSSDYNVTKRPPSTPKLTLRLEDSAVSVPIVGGEAALSGALGVGTPEQDESEWISDAGHLRIRETPLTMVGDGGPPIDVGTPGFGIGSALAGVGAAGYLLERRWRD